MNLSERAERVLAEVDAGRMTHNVQIELIALVRAFHAQSPALPNGPVIVTPAKDESNTEEE